MLLLPFSLFCLSYYCRCCRCCCCCYCSRCYCFRHHCYCDNDKFCSLYECSPDGIHSCGLWIPTACMRRHQREVQNTTSTSTIARPQVTAAGSTECACAHVCSLVCAYARMRGIACTCSIYSIYHYRQSDSQKPTKHARSAVSIRFQLKVSS